VIGTVGGRDKAPIAREAGCEHPIVYTKEDFVARCREITAGRGVDVVFDAIGPTRFPDEGHRDDQPRVPSAEAHRPGDVELNICQ
jgi:NADPH:quinone reductase-like Zn-dependent oxidoreductase